MEQGGLRKYPGGKEKIRRENGGVAIKNHPPWAILASATRGILDSTRNIGERHPGRGPYPTKI